MKKIGCVLLGLLLIVPLYAQSAPKSGKVTIGVTYCLLSAPAVKVFADGIRKEAAAQGVDIIELDASWDAQKQTDQIATLISQGVKGILLNPVDSKSIIPIVKKAHDAGIPVVMGAMNIDPAGAQYVSSYVGADEKDVGRAAGLLMKKTLGAGTWKVAIVEGVAGTDPQINRTAGFEEAIKGTGIKVVAKLAGDFDKAKALAVTQDALTRFPDLNGIWVHDDTMAVGVVQAIKSMGYAPGKVAVVSYNGSKVGADMVKAGDIVGTAVQPLAWEGATSLSVLIKAIKGQKVDRWYKDEILPITHDNVASYDPKLLW